MAFIYWNSENLEIQFLCLLSLQNQHHPCWVITNSSVTNIIIFPCCYFPLICNTPSPKPSGLRRHRTKFKLQNSRWFWYYLAQEESKGKRRRTHLCFFPARQGSVPCWPIPAVSPHPIRVPSQGASVGHGLPLASTARAPQRSTRALPDLQAGGIWLGPASNDP